MIYRVVDLFSGIGGFSLGLEATGYYKTVAFCEIEKFPQRVLRKHYPEVPIYEDVREITAERLRADGIECDIITAGFPCQDLSVAGKQTGIDGERSGLWSECARILGEVRPRYAIFENVTALLSGDSGRWFQRVLWDISQVGYDAEWHCIPAGNSMHPSPGAPHQRDRVWIICYPRRECNEPQRIDELSNGAAGEMRGEARQQRIRTETTDPGQDVPDTNNPGLQGRFGKIMRECSGERITRQGSGRGNGIWEPEPTVCRVADGIPDGLYQGRVATGVKDRVGRLKALGNSIVPQIAETIGMSIVRADIHVGGS